MPVYALEFKLAARPPENAVHDVFQGPSSERYKALAEELETAALLVPPPPAGVTGDAATYFSSVFDLLGGCAEPFYRHFASSPSPELRKAALEWLDLIQSRGLRCEASHGLP